MSGNEMLDNLLKYSPEIVAVVLVLTGWLLARVARRGIATGVPWINRIFVRSGADPGSVLTPAFVKGLQALAFWGIVLASAALALYLLGVGEPDQWLDGLLGFVPQLLLAGGILLVGHILGLLARALLAGVSESPDFAIIRWLAYGVIMTIAAITALRNLGMQLTFFTQVLLLIIGIFFAGIALAFALGARGLAANLAAQGELQRYRLGDRISIDGVDGTILEIHRTGIMLSTDNGLANIPASKFAELIVIENRKDAEDDG